MSKPKILVTTSSYPKGAGDASGVFVEELSKRLTGDFEVFVLAPYSKGSLKTEVREKVKITRFKYWPGKNLLADGEIMANLKKSIWFYLQVMPFFFFQFMSLRKIIRKEKISIIHTHWLIPQGLVASVYKKFFNRHIKIVGTIHGGDINNFGKFPWKGLLNFVLRNIDELTVVSNAIKNDIVQLGFRKEIFVYPMGVDTTLFAPEKTNLEIKRKLNITGNLLLFVGGINERKGIRYLIKAMPEILKEYADTTLLAVGDGTLMEEMKLLSHQLGIAQNVIFTGKIPHSELPPYFASADVFVLPSFSEGWPVVVMEAISAGLVCVVSDIPSFHGLEKGFLIKVKPGNESELTNGIKRAFDFNQKNQLGLNAREYAVCNFDWVVISDKFSSLIKSV